MDHIAAGVASSEEMVEGAIRAFADAAGLGK